MDLFWVTGLSRGCLATATRPRGGDWLVDDITDLARRKVTTLVSMLTPAENIELDLVREGTEAKGAGLHFVSVPVEDRGLPERAAGFLDAVHVAADNVAAGGAVVVHCRMGVGRSSMFAAATMVRLGVEPSDCMVVDRRGARTIGARRREATVLGRRHARRTPRGEGLTRACVAPAWRDKVEPIRAADTVRNNMIHFR